MALGEKVAIFDWEWAPREGQKMTCIRTYQSPLILNALSHVA